MQIQSKKTGLVHEVSKEIWAKMVQRNDHRHYKVLDDSDTTLISHEIEVEKVEWNTDNFNDDLAEAITQKTFEDDDEELEYIKEKLTEADVYFHPNTGIVKLRKLYEQI